MDFSGETAISTGAVSGTGLLFTHDIAEPSIKIRIDGANHKIGRCDG